MDQTIDQDVKSLNSIPSGKMADVEAALGFLEVDENLMPTAESLTKHEVGRAFYQLGKLHYDKSDLINGEANFLKAYSCAELPRDAFSVLKILGFLIRISSERQDDEKGAYYIKKAEKVAENLTGILGCLNSEYFYNVGIVKNYSGKFDEAKENFELAYKRSKEENEPELLSKCLLALATNSYNRKDYELSLEYLTQLNQLLKIINKNYLQGAMFLFAAKVYTELDLHEKALQNYKSANETLQEKKCWNLYGYILLGKGMVYKRMGDYDRALSLFKLAEESIDKSTFKRLDELIDKEIKDVNDSSVDLYLDRANRKVKEKYLGAIDFKHRFVLLEILFLLAKNPGSYYDKDALAKSIWKDEYNPLIHDKLIYTSVSRLRKLIEPKNDKGQKRKYIVRGKDGYTFNPLAKIRFHMETKSQDERTIGNVELSSPV